LPGCRIRGLTHLPGESTQAGAAPGDVIVSETTASYTIRAEGRKCREFGVDVYWVNDEGLIYHKHTCEVVEDYRDDALDAAREACQVHQGTSS
jgi:hypothetical protein